jgi:hypothetical protein
MFSPMVRRIIALGLAAPALLVATAVAASASEHHTPGAYYHSTGSTASSWGAGTWHVTSAVGWFGHHSSATWYRARTSDAGTLGAYTATVSSAAGDSAGHNWRARPDGEARYVHLARQITAPEITTHSYGTHMVGAAYHASDAQANAWGASTSTVNAASGEHGRGWGSSGYAWSERSGASANAWGANAGRTTSYASYGNGNYGSYGNGNWGHHSSWGHHCWGHGSDHGSDHGSAGYSASAAHAGYDGAWAGDIDSAAAYDY